MQRITPVATGISGESRKVVHVAVASAVWGGRLGQLSAPAPTEGAGHRRNGHAVLAMCTPSA